MQVEWTNQAIADLHEIEIYIEQDKPEAARKVAAHLESSIEHLGEFPELGRPGRRPGTRELIVPPFVITYRVRLTRLDVISIWHGRRIRQRPA